MNIHQISVTYQQEQDRCLVRINSRDGEELRLWFTRRLTLGLMPYLTHTASEQLKLHTASSPAPVPVEARRAHLLERFQKEAEVYNGDFKTPFKPEAAQLPLGSEPVLITEVKLNLQATGKVDLQLIEKSAEQIRNIQLAMNPQLMQGLLHMLGQAVKKSEWLTLPPTPADLALPPGHESPGLLDATERPKYLN